MPDPAGSFTARLAEMRLADARRLKSRLARARERQPSPEQWAALVAEVDAATARYAARVASRPSFAYPPEHHVVWVSPDGKHGLVCETIDQSVAITWYEADSPLSDPANHSVDGAYFADWRLPTQFELDQYLYPQRAAIGNFDETPSPSVQAYWSSTSVSDPNAWIVDFALGGGGLGNQAKGTFGFVRSVRSF